MESLIFDGAVEEAIFAGIKQFKEIIEWLSVRMDRKIEFRITGTWKGAENYFTASGQLLKRYDGEIFENDLYLLLESGDIRKDIAINTRFLHFSRPRTINLPKGRFKRKQPKSTPDLDDKKDKTEIETIVLLNTFKNDTLDSMFFRKEDYNKALSWMKGLLNRYKIKVTLQGYLVTPSGKINCIANGFAKLEQDGYFFADITSACNLDDPEDTSILGFLKERWLFKIGFEGFNVLEPEYLFFELGEDDIGAEKVLDVKNLSVSFGEKKILDDVSFSIDKGEILGIIGESGGGKTTTLNAVLGQIDYEGLIHIAGINATSTKTISSFIGFIPQELSRMYENFNPLENILAFASQFNLPQEYILTRGKKLLSDLGIETSQPVKTLSGGQKRRVSIAIAMTHNPRIIFLDEPTSGLDPTTRFELWKYLDIINKEYGITLVVISHYLDEIEFCDKASIYLMDYGFYDFGTPEELKGQLPGGGLALEVTLEMVSVEAFNSLKTVEGVEFVIQRGERLRLLSNIPTNELIPRVIKKLEEGGYDIHSLEMKVEIDMVDYFTYVSTLRDENKLRARNMDDTESEVGREE